MIMYYIITKWLLLVMWSHIPGTIELPLWLTELIVDGLNELLIVIEVFQLDLLYSKLNSSLIV